MRTTVRLDERLLDQAKAEARKRGETLTSLMEQGLRLVLARKPERHHRARVVIPVSTAKGGTLPGVDINNSAALEDLMDGSNFR